LVLRRSSWHLPIRKGRSLKMIWENISKRTSGDSPRMSGFGLLQDYWLVLVVSRFLNLNERLGVACECDFDVCGDMTGLCCIQN
jgi:hypothetical protein